MGQEKHAANSESRFLAVSITPDFCQVGDHIVPFDIVRTLDHEHSAYTQQVFAASKKMLLIDSVLQGVEGNAGHGIRSGVSLTAGNCKILTGTSAVMVEGRAIARQGDLLDMNRGGSQSNATYGRLMTAVCDF